MRNTFCLVTALAVLAVSPAFAKIEPEFPSRSIRPVISTTEPNQATGQVAPQRRVTPLPERLTPANSRACGRPYVARDAADNAERRDCQPENSINSQSEIPQLRAFRQPSSPRFAP